MVDIGIALVPLLLLLVSLLVGHYPGLETIVRLSERMATWRRSRSARRQARPEVPRFAAIAGGLLIAFGLATRPPPAPLPS